MNRSMLFPSVPIEHDDPFGIKESNRHLQNNQVNIGDKTGLMSG